ncbi:MAG: hypothetical protein AAGF95_14515 [Chloroflexota bacterium]
MHVTPSDELVTRLSNHLHAYLRANPPDPKRWDSYAHQLEAFPIGADIYAAWFVRPSGEVLVWIFLSEDEEDIRPEPHAWVRYFVIREGAEQFPDLSELLPPRPAESKDCPDCQGTGTIWIASSAGRKAPRPCRPCDSLGWLETAT